MEPWQRDLVRSFVRDLPSSAAIFFGFAVVVILMDWLSEDLDLRPPLEILAIFGVMFVAVAPVAWMRGNMAQLMTSLPRRRFAAVVGVGLAWLAAGTLVGVGLLVLGGVR